MMNLRGDMMIELSYYDASLSIFVVFVLGCLVGLKDVKRMLNKKLKEYDK